MPSRSVRPSGRERASPSGPVARWAPWAAGIGAAVLVLGPALAPGPLLNLDLVLFDDVPVPGGAWGLGPDVPRRVPLFLPLAWLSSTVGGATAGKALMVLCIAAAVAGAHRLAEGSPPLARAGAAALYGLSPWLLSRIGVGHLGIAVPAALLPWALPDLLRPSDRPARSFLWMAALGACGFVGGTFAALAVGVGLLADRGARAGRVLGALALAQLPWLVPGAVVLLQGSASPAESGGFATVVPGPLGVFEVAAGHGLWLSGHQVGRHVPGTWLVGLVVCVLAVAGRHGLPRPWGRRAAGLAVVGLALSLASGLPLVDRLYEAVADTPVGAPLREGQRVLALWLVWAAPAAAHGAARLARAAAARRAALGPLVLAVPLALALVLAGPAAWGLGGILRPVDLPPEWAEARAAVEAEPGTVLALPWTRYLVAEVAGNRRILNPVPLYLGGDVLSSSDPQVGEGAEQELADPREEAAELQVVRIRTSERTSAELADLGVRWVLLLHELSWEDHEGLDLDPGLEPVVEGPTLTLYRVRPWTAPVVDDDGAPVALDPVVAPWAELDPSGPATWAQAAAGGWLRGLEPAGRTSDGLVRLPGGSGPLWYWPSLLVLAADGVVVVAVLVAARRAREPQDSVDP